MNIFKYVERGNSNMPRRPPAKKSKELSNLEKMKGKPAQPRGLVDKTPMVPPKKQPPKQPPARALTRREQAERKLAEAAKKKRGTDVIPLGAVEQPAVKELSRQRLRRPLGMGEILREAEAGKIPVTRLGIRDRLWEVRHAIEYSQTMSVLIENYMGGQISREALESKLGEITAKIHDAKRRGPKGRYTIIETGDTLEELRQLKRERKPPAKIRRKIKKVEKQVAKGKELENILAEHKQNVELLTRYQQDLKERREQIRDKSMFKRLFNR